MSRVLNKRCVRGVWCATLRFRPISDLQFRIIIMYLPRDLVSYSIKRGVKKVRRGNPKTFSFKTKQEVRASKISQKRKNTKEKQKDGAKKNTGKKSKT